MLYDNSTTEKSVASWILEQTKTGRLDVTSGYFTVGILAMISRKLNEKIDAYRFVLGDIVALKNSGYSLKYILGVFNSTLINFWYRCHFPNVNINPGDFREIPVRKASEGEQKRIVGIVDKINEKKDSDPAADTSRLESEIDQLVYALYGLTPEEIAIVAFTSK